jgi:hypothetical protein
MTPRIDWWRVIVDLGYQGYSHQRIADELLVGKSWVAGVKNSGHEPRHRDGEMLLALWSQVMSKPATDAPRSAVSAESARERWRLGLNRSGTLG